MWFITDDRDEHPALAHALVARPLGRRRGRRRPRRRCSSNGKDRLVTLAFSAEPLSLLDMLPSRKKDNRAAASAPRPDRVLHELGDRRDASARRVGHQSGSACRARRIASGSRICSAARARARPPSSGRRGAGKTMLIHQWIADRLVEDGYPIHKNLDRCHHVWRLSGKRLIAGMSSSRPVGGALPRGARRGAQAQAASCGSRISTCSGRLGQSRQSERSFADFFRGPVRRGDLAILAELTRRAARAARARCAGSRRGARARRACPPRRRSETAHAAAARGPRARGAPRSVALHPFVPRTALELGAALFPWRARPGVAIEIVRRVAEDAHAKGASASSTPNDVLDYLARTTGLSPKLITLDAAARSPPRSRPRSPRA